MFSCNHTVFAYVRNVRTYVRIISLSIYLSLQRLKENQTVLSQGTFIHSFIPTAAATAGDVVYTNKHVLGNGSLIPFSFWPSLRCTSEILLLKL